MSEDASDNSIEGVVPGMRGLKERRKSSNEIYFKKLARNDELQTLY